MAPSKGPESPQRSAGGRGIGLLKWLLGFAEPPTETRVEEAPEQRTTVEWDRAGFEQKLRELSGRHPELLAASVHVIGLQKVKEHFGPRWGAVSDRVHSVINQIVERHMGPTGLHSCYQDLAYVLVFAGMAPKMAQLRCGLIVEEISRRLFGAGHDGSMIDVTMAVIAKDKGIQFRPVSPQDVLTRVLAQQADGRVEVPVPGAAPVAPERNRPASAGGRIEGGEPIVTTPTGGDRWRSENRGRIRPDEDEAEDEGRTPPSTEPAWRNLAYEPEQRDRDWVEAPPASLAEPPRAATGEETGGGEAEPGIATERIVACDDWIHTSPYALGSLDFVFRPIWNVRKRVASAFLCLSARVTPEGILLLGDSAVPTGTGSELHLGLDGEQLHHVVRQLAQRPPGHREPYLITSVHAVSVMRNDCRAAFQATCRRIPRSFRSSLAFEVVGVDDRVPASRLSELPSVLRPFCAAVFLRLPLDYKNFAGLRNAGFHAVGISMEGRQDNEAAAIHRMGRFAEAASRRGLRSFVHGLRSRSLTSAAVAAGFNYIDGDTIEIAADGLNEVSPFDIDSLYKPLLGAL